MGIQLNKLNDRQLYENHDQSTLKRWCKSLKFFHYMRARRGHNCEGDTFAVHFTYDGKEDLLKKLSQIGVEIQRITAEDLVFDPLESYALDDLDRIKYTIPGFDDLIQPHLEDVLGQAVHVWVQQHTFELIVAGDVTRSVYEVGEDDFQICLQLENDFERMGWNVFLDEEIKKQPHCISEVLYPELYV